jgi:hypothetical protein
LRFFLSADHTTDMVDIALDALIDAMRELKIKT